MERLVLDESEQQQDMELDIIEEEEKTGQADAVGFSALNGEEPSPPMEMAAVHYQIFDFLSNFEKTQLST
jgi:hypothetical protein